MGRSKAGKQRSAVARSHGARYLPARDARRGVVATDGELGTQRAHSHDRIPKEREQSVVPKRGLEPPRACAHMVLNHARLPFRHFGTLSGGRFSRLPVWLAGRAYRSMSYCASRAKSSKFVREREKRTLLSRERAPASGAEGGIRTHTGVTPEDFESSASAIPPLRRAVGFIAPRRRRCQADSAGVRRDCRSLIPGLGQATSKRGVGPAPSPVFAKTAEGGCPTSNKRQPGVACPRNKRPENKMTSEGR